MKQCWGKNEDSEAVLAAWKKTPFLVIDEAQTRAGTEWENNVLDELINARYAKMLPTVIIANITMETAQKSLGPRIMDRANECGGIVNCDWESYRK
jgi:DNA replication protein DnaC